jgi:hypothetical protein
MIGIWKQNLIGKKIKQGNRLLTIISLDMRLTGKIDIELEDENHLRFVSVVTAEQLTIITKKAIE